MGMDLGMETPLSPEPNVAPDALVVDSDLGRFTEIAERARVVECEIGDYSYVMNDADLMYAKVGKFVSIASHVRVNPSNHPMWRPALHHFTYRSVQYGFGPDDAEIFDWRRGNAVTIGPDVWLGSGVIVLPGLRVGTGAVVGAGAVVTKDVAPYAVMVGVPARKVKDRFPKDVREALLRIRWWDWPHEQIAKALADFRSPDVRDFIRKYGKPDH